MKLSPCVFALAVFLVGIANADEQKTVTREEVVGAFQEYRIALKLVTMIHRSLEQQPGSFEGKPSDKIEFAGERLVDYKKARKHLEKSISLNPYFPEAYVFLANSYWEIESDLKKTIQYFDKAIELDPEYAEAISARGHFHVLRKDMQKARQDLKRLEKLDSEYVQILKGEIEFVEQDQ